MKPNTFENSKISHFFISHVFHFSDFSMGFSNVFFSFVFFFSIFFSFFSVVRADDKKNVEKFLLYK